MVRLVFLREVGVYCLLCEAGPLYVTTGLLRKAGVLEGKIGQLREIGLLYITTGLLRETGLLYGKNGLLREAGLLRVTVVLKD
jgi:hypothetical protein